MNVKERQKRMETLDRGIRRCRKCPLHQKRKHAVPGEGPVYAELFFIGEAPGAEEDRMGRPFVGHSGVFFNKMLTAVGIERQDVYITSTVKCRTPKNRKPKENEMKACRKNWLDNQIKLVNPSVIVLLGQTACQLFLKRKESLSSLHGRLYRVESRNFFVTFHPAAAMRFPLLKRKLQKDLKSVEKVF